MGRSFISYAHEDSDIAEFLHQDLSDIGADPWMDTHDIIAGQNWTNVITEVIREAMAVIVLLSANSVSKRGVLQFEIKLALDALKTIPPGDVFLIPVRLDDCTPRDDQLRELQWVDLFPSYESGLAQIRRGLDAAAVIPAAASRGLSVEAQRLKRYRILFDRPAFRVPCIFEGELLDVEAATKHVSAAMATGSLYSRDDTVLAQLTPISEFEPTPRFRDGLDRVRLQLSGIVRAVGELQEFLGIRAKSDESENPDFWDMEVLLRDRIAGAATQEYVRRAFELLDLVDSERNIVLEQVNVLMDEAMAPPLPFVTLSSEQLRVSEEIEVDGGRGSQRWDLFYLRTHSELTAFLEQGPLSFPLHILKVPDAVLEILKDCDMWTIADLCDQSRGELLALKGIGTVRVRQLEDALADQFGAHLAER